jgi:hypothetical protein
LMKIGSTPLTIDCPYQRMAISDANKGMAWSRGIISEPDYYRSIDRIKKWPDAKNLRLNLYFPCPRGLPNIENWPKLLFYMEKWKILEPTRQFITIQSLLIIKIPKN